MITLLVLAHRYSWFTNTQPKQTRHPRARFEHAIDHPKALQIRTSGTKKIVQNNALFVYGCVVFLFVFVLLLLFVFVVYFLYLYLNFNFEFWFFSCKKYVDLPCWLPVQRDQCCKWGISAMSSSDKISQNISRQISHCVTSKTSDHKMLHSSGRSSCTADAPPEVQAFWDFVHLCQYTGWFSFFIHSDWCWISIADWCRLMLMLIMMLMLWSLAVIPGVTRIEAYHRLLARPFQHRSPRFINQASHF